MSSIREWLSGKKTYLTAVVGILTALIAWASGEISNVQLATAIFISFQTMFVRAGVKKSAFSADEVADAAYGGTSDAMNDR